MPIRDGRLAALATAAFLTVAATSPGAAAESYTRVSGAGSSWSEPAISAWASDVRQYGMSVDYASSGSSDGRNQFIHGTVDFAASDIPFQFHPEDGSSPEKPPPGYAYMPVTAGGTVFMYNLTISGVRVTNLRLSGAIVAEIFTGVITKWSDPAIAADNPALALPDKAIVPVVRSDGSGSTAQFTSWMINRQGDLWNDYCHRTGRSACGMTSYYPTVSGMIAQAGDLGVAGYVAQSIGDGAIGYVNYSYALNLHFPVAKVLNSAGYYTEPTPENVAVSLLKAQINGDTTSEAYLTQKLDDVYTDPDPRTYELSSYSYMILPTEVRGQFDADKGKTLAAFSYYAMCQGQQQMPSLGFSPMPINLVQAGFEQIRRVPGAAVQDIKVETCNNPTFSPDGHNRLADTAPMPEACDKQGPDQCATGTGGARKATPASKKAAGAAAAGTGGSAAGPAAAAAAGPVAAGGKAGPASAAAKKGKDAAAAGTGPPATGTAPQSCVDTGDCAAAADTGASADAASAAAAPLTLTAHRGWSGDQTLAALAVLLVLALVFAPAVALHLLGSRR